jgi:hypothetical protein
LPDLLFCRAGFCQVLKNAAAFATICGSVSLSHASTAAMPARVPFAFSISPASSYFAAPGPKI